MNTVYKRRAASPAQAMKNRSFDVRQTDHPAQEHIQRLLGSYQLEAIVEEDLQTLTTLRHVDGLIAFLCSIKREGKLIGQGRGSAVLNPQNRFISRVVRAAFNSSVIDATMKATKVLDTLAGSSQTEGANIQIESGASDGITPKQKQFLLELVQTRVADKGDREQWVAELDGLSREDASLAIANFVK